MKSLRVGGTWGQREIKRKKKKDNEPEAVPKGTVSTNEKRYIGLNGRGDWMNEITWGGQRCYSSMQG